MLGIDHDKKARRRIVGRAWVVMLLDLSVVVLKRLHLHVTRIVPAVWLSRAVLGK